MVQTDLIRNTTIPDIGNELEEGIIRKIELTNV